MHPGHHPGDPVIRAQAPTLAGTAHRWPAIPIGRDQNVTGSERYPGGYQVARAEAVNGTGTRPGYPKADNPLSLQSVAHLPGLQPLLRSDISDKRVSTGGTKDRSHDQLDPMTVRTRQLAFRAHRHDPDMHASLAGDIPRQSYLEFHLH
jgi:hypothetical protein